MSEERWNKSDIIEIVSRDDILRELEEYRENGYAKESRCGEATHKEFKYEGFIYPIKYIVCRAIEQKDNIDKKPNGFNPSVAWSVLKELLGEENIEEIKPNIQTTQKDITKDIDNMPKREPLNQILYGPPGTGKTYNTINKAVEIIDNEFYQNHKENIEENRKALKDKFEEYKKSGQIEFVTFHQSYGYEEFVEGIKAKSEDGNIDYRVEAGIFKKSSQKAKENYVNSKKSSIELGKEVSIKQKLELFLNDSIENDIEFSKTKGGKFKIKDLSDNEIVIYTEDSNYSDKTLTLLVEELFKILDSDIEIKTSRQMAKDIFNINNQRQKDTYYFSIYKAFQNRDFEEINISEVQEPLKNYILIIDEINRGNISKIFGELITLIEDSKRIGAKEEVQITLPYSNESFGVPNNLYILGTMNTADRSIALLDTALRRRFIFEEMMPKAELLGDIELEDIDFVALLSKINERIEYLYDRDHTIGHAYFMSLTENSNLNELKNIFLNKVVPLLQEYFYDDWSKIRLILGDEFITKKEINLSKLFKSGDDIDEKEIYELNLNAFNNIESYKKIYE